MNSNFFLDTNIFVYSFDEANTHKRQKASQLITQALSTQKGMISYQVVQEFINIAIKKFPSKFKQEDIEDYLQTVLLPLNVIPASEGLFQQALNFHYQHRVSFYDGLIIAAASQAHCRILFSEDLQHGQLFGSVRVQNPFLA